MRAEAKEAERAASWEDLSAAAAALCSVRRKVSWLILAGRGGLKQTYVKQQLERKDC